METKIVVHKPVTPRGRMVWSSTIPKGTFFFGRINKDAHGLPSSDELLFLKFHLGCIALHGDTSTWTDSVMIEDYRPLSTVEISTFE